MALAVKQIQEIARNYYQLEVKVKNLNGYEDQNFLLEDNYGNNYILKSSKENLPFIQAQIEVALHLESTELKGVFPAYYQNKFGTRITEYKIEGETYFVRLLSFLKGEFWVDYAQKNNQTYKSLGSLLGKMDRQLQGFDHVAIHRNYEWDLNQTFQAQKNLKYIENSEKQRIASYFLLQFETEVMPHLNDLRQACIHGDANDYNILVQAGQVTGLIDFGDMVWSSLINNLAIACTYAMLQTENPLEVATKVIEGYHSEFPLLEKELELLYYLIAARLCISVTQSAHKSFLQSTNEHHFLTENAAWKNLNYLLELSPLKATKAFKQTCGLPLTLDFDHNASQLIASRQKHIGRNLSLSYQQPLTIVKGALQYLYDDQGETYIDCVNNVSHVGHCHPVLVKAMQKQIATLNTNTRYINSAMMEYARVLTAKLPSSLSVCYFVNSGSEANDLAIRMARHFTNRQDIVVLDHAYHGTSTLALDMSPYKFDGKGGFPQKSFVHKAISPDLYRGPYSYQNSEAGKKYAESVSQIIQNQPGKIAAFICETLLGVGGQIPLPNGYLREVYANIRSAGGLCIADEVQVGFGRVGDTFWGFELQEVVPDIVVLGKPIGNGHPLAAVVVTEEIANRFNNGMEYFNTYGGNPVSMVAGFTVLNIIEKEGLQQHAKKVGKVLLEGFRKLQNKFEIIGDVRGHGLFVGVEFVRNRVSKEPAVEEINKIIEEMKSRKFLLSTDGPLNNVLKIKPPLVFSEKNANELVNCLDEILASL